MTPEEFHKLKWVFSSHLNMDGCSSTVRKADSPIPLLKCSRVSVDENGEPKGRTTVHYLLNGKVYKSEKKLFEALKELK